MFVSRQFQAGSKGAAKGGGGGEASLIMCFQWAYAFIILKYNLQY